MHELPGTYPDAEDEERIVKERRLILDQQFDELKTLLETKDERGADLSKTERDLLRAGRGKRARELAAKILEQSIASPDDGLYIGKKIYDLGKTDPGRDDLSKKGKDYLQKNLSRDLRTYLHNAYRNLRKEDPQSVLPPFAAIFGFFSEKQIYHGKRKKKK